MGYEGLREVRPEEIPRHIGQALLVSRSGELYLTKLEMEGNKIRALTPRLSQGEGRIDAEPFYLGSEDKVYEAA